MTIKVPNRYQGKMLVYHWTYRDMEGNIIGYVARYEDDDGNKIVVPFFKRKHGQYIAGIDIHPTPLYGYGPNFRVKVKKQKLVIVSEGEKTARTWSYLGYPSVTSQGGAHSANKADWSLFRDVSEAIINPDNDKPGEQYARQVYLQLKSVNPEIRLRILRLPNVPESGDIVDYIKRYKSDWDGYCRFDEDSIEPLKKRITKLLEKAEDIPESWKTSEIEDDEWLEPNAITDTKLLPVKKLTVAMIPKPFRRFISDTSYRMQSPIEFVAITMIVVTSSIIGNACIVCPKKKDDWPVTPNLWGACIGPPGLTMKSPSMGKVLSLLSRLQQKYFQLFEEQKIEQGLERKEIEAEISEIEDQLKNCISIDDEDEPTEDKDALKAKLVELSLKLNQRNGPRILVTNDSSYQSLAKLHETNPRGCLVHKDELPGMLAYWQDKKGAQERAFYLSGWNGNESYTDVKIGREMVAVPSICISLLGGIQPDRLLEYLEKTAKGGNDGMLQRFQLMVYPDTPEWEYVDQYPDNEAKNQVYEILEKLTEMDFGAYGATIDHFVNRPYFRFSQEAQEIFDKWYIENQAKITNESNSLIQEHLAKYRSLMPSLALIFHLVKIADSNKPIRHISPRSTKEAIAWCRLLESHARRIYGMVAPSAKSAAIHLAKQIIDGKVSSPFTAKDIYDKKWGGLKDSTMVETACNILIRENWLKRIDSTESTGGRPRGTTYIVNPSILK